MVFALPPAVLLCASFLTITRFLLYLQNFFAIIDNSQPVDKPRCETLAYGSAVATFQNSQLCVRMNMNGVQGETLTRIEGPADIGIDGEIKYKLSLGPQKIECVTITDSTEIGLLFDGFMYINVRSAACPQGEIRGQLLPT